MDKQPIVIVDGNQFWNGRDWSSEFPEAVLYDSVLDARKAIGQLRSFCNKRAIYYHNPLIVLDYGLDSETIVR